MRASYISRLAVSLMFLLAGSGKFLESGNMAQNFKSWGYSILLLRLVAVFEIVGACLIIFNRTFSKGSILIVCVMIGAIVTHIRFYDQLGFPFLNLLVIAVLSIPLIFRNQLLNPINIKKNNVR